MNEMHRMAGTMAADGFAVALSAQAAGWKFASLRVAELAPGGAVEFDTVEDEVIVLPLSGGCRVAIDDVEFELDGRSGVFAGVSDFAYAPRDTSVRISSPDGGRFALPGARARRRLPIRYQPASATPVELRGAGVCSRQLVNFCTPQTFEADRLIAVEAYTPAGNWATFPPHKHDTDSETESSLEEIYFYEIADGPSGAGFAYQRAYAADERPIDVLTEVRSGDVVLIPHGWHGPTMAVPGYDAYWLNVMAGPGAERAWRVCEDPSHSWVRETWVDQPIDPRLPLAGFDIGNVATNPDWGRTR